MADFLLYPDFFKFYVIGISLLNADDADFIGIAR